MEQGNDAVPFEAGDPEMRELLGLFDAPAFARRALDLEYSLARLRARCQRQRDEMLGMVRLRLRQWAQAVTGPDAWVGNFDAPVDSLWPLSGAEPPVWAAQSASSSRQRAAARALVASLLRFNNRWSRFLTELDFSYINNLIEQYNRYYVFEKECCVGSARIAAQHFRPKETVSRERLLAEFPPLPVPV
jgi:hypothetical protein